MVLNTSDMVVMEGGLIMRKLRKRKMIDSQLEDIGRLTLKNLFIKEQIVERLKIYGL